MIALIPQMGGSWALPHRTRTHYQLGQSSWCWRSTMGSERINIFRIDLWLYLIVKYGCAPLIKATWASATDQSHAYSFALVACRQHLYLIVVEDDPKFREISLSLTTRDRWWEPEQTLESLEALHNSSMLSIAHPQGTNIFQLVIGTVLCFK